MKGKHNCCEKKSFVSLFILRLSCCLYSPPCLPTICAHAHTMHTKNKAKKKHTHTHTLSSLTLSRLSLSHNLPLPSHAKPPRLCAYDPNSHFLRMSVLWPSLPALCEHTRTRVFASVVRLNTPKGIKMQKKKPTTTTAKKKKRPQRTSSHLPQNIRHTAPKNKYLPCIA